jgi:hypothetical protein
MDPHGSYMQNSAAIDEKAFEDDEEDKNCSVVVSKGNQKISLDDSPSYQNKINNIDENIVPKKPTRNTISGTVFFKFSEDHIEKYHMCLKGADLYCYDFDTKKQIKFMHSLVGCFLISPTKACENSQHDVNESING